MHNRTTIINRLQDAFGHDPATCARYYETLLADELHPAIAFVAIESCFQHDGAVVFYWLKAPTEGPSARAMVDYLVAMRRRALKVKAEWPEHRFEWTNHLNRVRHYAEKLLDD